jgi:type IV pilus assembly protein PilN
VILINLLPHREAKRASASRRSSSAWVAALLRGPGHRGVWYGAAADDFGQQARNQFLRTRSRAGRADQGHRHAARRDRRLKARQKAVEDLQTDRNTPVHLLDELVRRRPRASTSPAIKQTGQVVSVNGVAQTNERVSELLRNTALQLGLADQARTGRDQGR